MKILLIDGENTRKTITKNFLEDKNLFLNFNLNKILASENLNIIFDEVVWFSAKIQNNKEYLNKSKELVDFQRRMFNILRSQNINIDLSGRIQKINNFFKEKGVDVAIATKLISAIYENKEVEIFLWSNDTDLIPALKLSKNKNVKITYITLDDVIMKSILFNTSSVVVLKTEKLKEIFKTKTPAGVNQAGAFIPNIIAEDVNNTSGNVGNLDKK